MSYQLKAALVIGFSLCLLVAVVVADHFSAARQAMLQNNDDGEPAAMPLIAPPLGTPAPTQIAAAGAGRTAPPAAGPVGGSAPTEAPLPEPVVIANGPTASFAERGGGGVGSGGGGWGVPGSTVRGGPAGLLGELLNDASGVRTLMETRERPSTELAGRGATVERRPVATGGVSSEATPAVATSAGAGGSEPAPRMVMYRVKPGDKLYHIARRVLGDGNRWRELRDMNSDVVSEDGGLSVGTILTLPASRDSGQARPRSGDRPTSDRPTPDRGSSDRGKPRSGERRTYTVKRGDTLSLIAQRELGTIRRQAELLEVNASRIRDPDDIYVGMTLELPI